MILTDHLYNSFIKAASLAPSADNMQPWEFYRKDNSIQVYYAKKRALPTDAWDMFGWMSVGAAIQNIVIAAKAHGLSTFVDYNNSGMSNLFAANLMFADCTPDSTLAECIQNRITNRHPFKTSKLCNKTIKELNKAVGEFDVHIHWTIEESDFLQISKLDAKTSYIRLDHKPLHDELFSILRFTRKEMNQQRYGLTFESLEVPPIAAIFARYLQYWLINEFVSKLGLGKWVAKRLSVKLCKTGALCLLSVSKPEKVHYIQAGRALENLWLTATKVGLSIQPYGGLSQFLTKKDTDPSFFQKSI